MSPSNLPTVASVFAPLGDCNDSETNQALRKRDDVGIITGAASPVAVAANAVVSELVRPRFAVLASFSIYFAMACRMFTENYVLPEARGARGVSVAGTRATQGGDKKSLKQEFTLSIRLCSMAFKRRVNMPKPFVKAVALSGAVVASALFALSADAAQVLTPKRNAVAIDTVSLPAGTTVAAGTTLYIDMDYSVTGSQTQDEAGLGLKIGYDSNVFDLVVPATSITALHTKCMIASPSDQLVSGTMREVVFGWIDTSIRTTPTAGAVGWPGTADPAAPGATNGCLNPGSIVTESGAVSVSPSATLFRIGLKSKATFTAGSTNVTVNTAGNISYANAGNVDTAKTILVNGAAAPTCNLDMDGDGLVTAARDGVLLQRAMNPGVLDANVIAGVSFTPIAGAPFASSRTTGADVRAYLATFASGNGATILDVDGSGSTTAPVDGNAIKRALNPGILSANITLGLAVTAGTTGAAIRTYLNNNCGTTLTP